MTMSQASGRFTPAPIAAPVTTAMVTTGEVRSASNAA